MKAKNAIAAITLMWVGNTTWSQVVPTATPTTTPTTAPTAATSPPSLNGPIVATAQGKAQGLIANDVVIFKGLPFAASPVGDLRWRAPAAPAKWVDVRAANAFGATCAESEDCLYLNIYEPPLQSRVPACL